MTRGETQPGGLERGQEHDLKRNRPGLGNVCEHEGLMARVGPADIQTGNPCSDERPVVAPRPLLSYRISYRKV